jgi:hypothetical protein
MLMMITPPGAVTGRPQGVTDDRQVTVKPLFGQTKLNRKNYTRQARAKAGVDVSAAAAGLSCADVTSLAPSWPGRSISLRMRWPAPSITGPSSRVTDL